MIIYHFRIPKSLMRSEETRELAALIASDIVTNARSESGFDAVVGHDAAKAALEEAVLLPLRHPDLFRQSGLEGSQARKRSSSVTACTSIHLILVPSC